MIAGRFNWPRQRVLAFAALVVLAMVVVVLTVLAASPPGRRPDAGGDAAEPAGATPTLTARAGPAGGGGTGPTAADRSVAGSLGRDLLFVISDGPGLEFNRMVLPSPAVEPPSDVRAYVQRTDLVIVAIEPSVSYLAMLADRTLRGEVEILRLLAEAGGGSDAAAAVTAGVIRSPVGSAAAAHQRLLRTLNFASIGAQRSTITTITGPPAITESLQRRLVGNAIQLYLTLLKALALLIDQRSELLGIDAAADAASPTPAAAREAATQGRSAPS